jgi:hypothetical protein
LLSIGRVGTKTWCGQSVHHAIYVGSEVGFRKLGIDRQRLF